MGGFGDFGGFAFGAMIAPQVVFAEGLHVFADGNYRGTGGVEGDGLDLIAADGGLFQHFAHGGGEGAHVIVVRLRGVFGIFALAMKRIFLDGGLE